MISAEESGAKNLTVRSNGVFGDEATDDVYLLVTMAAYLQRFFDQLFMKS